MSAAAAAEAWCTVLLCPCWPAGRLSAEPGLLLFGAGARRRGFSGCVAAHVGRWFVLLDYNPVPLALCPPLSRSCSFWAHTCSGMGLGMYGLRSPPCEGIGYVLDVDLGVRACRTHAGASLPFLCSSFLSSPLLFCPFLPASPFVRLHDPWVGMTSSHCSTVLPGLAGVIRGVHAWVYVFVTPERQLLQQSAQHGMHSHWVCLAV